MSTGSAEGGTLTAEGLKADVASLARVSHRLAIIDDAAQFESVVAKLLPKLLARMGKNHQQMQSSGNAHLKPQLEQIQSKLMEILSHVLKRVKQSTTSSFSQSKSDNTSTEGPLPCQAILDQLVERNNDGSYQVCQNVDALTKNLSLTFLSVGVPKTPNPSSLLPGLLVCLHEERKRQQLSNNVNVANAASTITLLILHTLLALSPPPLASMNASVSSAKSVSTVSSFEDQEMIRLFLHQNEDCAAILYELILDVLLWTLPKAAAGGAASTLPPEGLSQQSQERLKACTSSNLWTTSLDKTKLALLDLIAPCRRAILLGTKGGTNARNVARTTTLMLVAKGNSLTAENATTYFQMYMNRNSKTSNGRNRKKRPASDTLQRVDISNDDGDETSTRNIPVASDELILELVALTVGQGQAESIANEVEASTRPTNVFPLHCAFERASIDSAILWSGKRRAVNFATTASVLWNALALQLVPLRQESVGSATSSLHIMVGNMLAFLGEKYLSSPQGASSAMSSLQAKPYLALAELLQAQAVQVCKGAQSPEEEDLKVKFMKVMEDVLNRQVAASMSVESRNTSMIMNSEGSWAMREECYAIISHLCRASKDSGYIVSMRTAKLLFSCASKEHERLRPCSVACLDSLLEAFTRIYSKIPGSKLDKGSALQSEADNGNPWASVPGQAKGRKVPSTNENEARDLLSRTLVPLLWSAAASHHPKASRVAAARWAHVLLKRNEFDVAKGCHLLSFLAGDQDVTVASLANQGLFDGMNTYDDDEGLPTLVDIGNVDSSEDHHVQLDFSKFADLVFRYDQTATSAFPQYQDFSFAGKAASLKFGLLCLLIDLYGGEDVSVALYLDAMIKTLLYFLDEASSAVPVRDRASTELLECLSICLLSLLRASSFARVELTRADSVFLSQKLTLLQLEELAINSRSSKARRYFAGAVGALFEDKSLWEDSHSLERWMRNTGIDALLERCTSQVGYIQKSHYQTGRLHGSIHLTGRVIRALRLQIINCKNEAEHSASMSRAWEQCTALLGFLGLGILHNDEILSNASVGASGIALSFDSLQAPQLGKNLIEGTSLLLQSVAKAIDKFANGDAVEPFRVISLIKTAGYCLGATSVIETATEMGELHQARSSCVAAIISTLGSNAFRKEEEVALFAGEALGMYADSCSFENSRLSWPLEFEEEFSKRLSPHEFVYYILLAGNLKASSPHKRTSTAAALLGLVGRAARLVHSDKCNQDRSFIQFTLTLIGTLQTAFISLLADPKIKHLSRESCCLGLAALRGLASFSQNDGESSLDADGLNRRLLQAFGQTTNFGGSVYQETQEQAQSRRGAEQDQDRTSNTESRIDLEQFGMESEIGGAAGLGEAALGAYREMAGAALAINRPDITYALLILSISHPAWFVGGTRKKYNAANLLGDSNGLGDKSNAIELRRALRPHLGKLLPRILRACNDPNKETRDQMGVLWVALAGGGAESREIVSENFLNCVDILTKEASNKLWRARSGALGALSDIIVGRDWTAFGGGPPILNEDDMYDDRPTSYGGVRLLRLWRVVVRAQDDVRDSCRTQGASLGRALKGVTIRMCDPAIAEKSSGEAFTPEEKTQWARDAASVTATSLRWLVKGLAQTVPETQGLCISTLAELIRVARPSIIEASLPDVLRSLLLAISGLEPSAFNYLQLRTENQEDLERARLQLAQNGPLSEAVTRCLELLPKAKPEIQQRVVSELDAALRLSVGFATRASVADCATLMCRMCPNAFDFPSSTNNPSIRLMRAFYFAAERERGQGAKEKMIHALGTIAALCPGGAVRKLAVRASARYKTCIGNNDDPSSRRAAAAALRAIAVRASNQMADGGASNVWASTILPVAFLGKRDTDKKAAALMKEVWDESSSSGVGDGKMFGTAIEEQLLTSLVGECANALQDVAWSRRIAGAEALIDLCESGILAPMARSAKVQSKMSDHDLERAGRRAKSSFHAITECMEVIMKPRLWVGKNRVVSAVGKLISKWTFDDVNDQFYLGWNGESGQCPWNPISLDSNKEDLYIGDQRFSHSLMIIDDDEEEKEVIDAKILESSPNLDSNHLSISEAEEDAEMETDLVVEQTLKGPSQGTLRFVGACRLLLQEALPKQKKPNNELSEEYQPYRVSCLNIVRDLLTSLSPSQSTLRRSLFLAEEEMLVSCLDDKVQMEPVLIAGALSCLSACLWNDFGSSSDMIDTIDPVELCIMIGKSCGKKQPAWTVRKAGSLSLASFVTLCDRSLLRNPRILSTCIGQATYALGDKKFWRVRESGLRLVGAVISRAGSSAERDTLMLEALLPHKEELFLLLRKGLVDSEPAVTALSSEFIPLISWWP